MFAEGIIHIPTDRRLRSGFIAIVTLRALFFATFTYFVNQLLGLGTNVIVLSLASAVAVFGSSALAFSYISNRGFIVGCALFYFAVYATFSLLDLLGISPSSNVFLAYSAFQHLNMVLLVMGISGGLTWFFWRSAHTLSIETGVLILVTIAIFAGHRNYRFDLVASINTIAWNLGMSQLAALVFIGAGAMTFCLLYLHIATLPIRPEWEFGGPQYIPHNFRANRFYQLVVNIVLLLIIYFVSYATFSYHQEQIATRIKNGVGDDVEEGMSPLDFHSALGRTSQPAALVRLEGDYGDNPFSPMLFLREAALSKLNGIEFVAAGKEYDVETPRISPRQRYKWEGNPNHIARTPVEQSIFLLSNNKLAFAIDYPLSIVRIKNPAETKKFKTAYKAYSMAPAHPADSLLGRNLGDPEWTEKMRAHYLATHPDERYGDFAKKITDGIADPIEKALAITNFLNKNAIYTLTPNHNVNKGEDPVAPFLFGDLRGYCVHFAHAVAAMYRTLGIPSRVATGFLTDLSESKDGHILLRMSDRHAWAEAYIEGYGWLPFDVQPEQVENHGETPVDMNLLEELMGLLGPSEEILPEGLTDDEVGVNPMPSVKLPELATVVRATLLAVLIVILVKGFLLLWWVLPGSEETRIRRTHISILAFLAGIGLIRRSAETRSEFQKRVRAEVGVDPLETTEMINRLKYAPEVEVKTGTTASTVKRMVAQLNNLPIWKRILGVLNLNSVYQHFFKRRW